MTADVLALLPNLVLTLTVIAALIFGVTEVRAAARDRRKRFAIQTLRTFQTRDFAQLVQFILAQEFPPNYEGFRTRPAEDQACFIQFAQEMESIGILVAEHDVDMDLLDKTMGVFVANAWVKYRPMFLDMREKLPDPFLGEYFQWLAERTGARRNAITAVRLSSRTNAYASSLPAVSLFKWLQ